MEIRYNIINVAEILSQLGKDIEANAIDKLIEVDNNWYYDQYNGFARCIHRFLDGLPMLENEEMRSNYDILRVFLSEFLDKEKFYDSNNDSLDMLYCLSNAKSQPIMMLMLDNYESKYSNVLMSRRFTSKLSDILVRDEQFRTVEGRLFHNELIQRYCTTNFSKLFDRNFDAKETEDDFEISYVPKGKTTVMGESSGKWSKTNRINAKFVKAIKKIPFRYKYSNRFYELLNNSVVAAYSNKITLSVVNGSDIVNYYDQKNYINGDTSSLGNSCMRYDHCSEYIEFYAANTSNVDMLIALNQDGLLCGRAILWKANCGTKIMDRIYGTDVMVEKFKRWAIDNDYVHKEYQSYDSSSSWIGKDGCFNQDYDITVNNIRKMPYMDSFKYTDDIDGSTMVLSNSDGSYCFTDTDGCSEAFDGSDDDEYYVYCNRTDDRIHIDDARCVGGEYYREELCVFAQDIGEYDLESDCVWLEYKNIWVSEMANITYIDNEDSFRCEEYVYDEDATELPDGTYCLSSEVLYNEIIGADMFNSGDVVDVTYKLSEDTEVTMQVCSDWYDNDKLLEDINANTTEEVLEVYFKGELIYKLEEVIND
jgi:hypothetical protein